MLPASEDVTAVTNLLFDTRHFLDATALSAVRDSAAKK
jgi:hypothetical protein